MSSNPKVTVLMPCYNAEMYLNEAVDSILNQTYGNLEILLIDDGSSDRTKDMIQNYAKKDSRVVPVFNEKNLGLIRTLNKGVMMATGEYIARMDADDISSLNRIERIVEEFSLRPECDVISAGYYRISASGKVMARIYPKATISNALKFVSLFCTPVIHPCIIAKTKVFSDNLFDMNYLHSEDYEIFSRLLFSGYKFLNLTEPLYYLRMNTQSVSFKYERIQISTHTKISVRNIENFLNIKYDFFLHKVMINRINFDVNPALLRKTFRSFKDLRIKYFELEQPASDVIAEIDGFLNEQYIDIYFQSFKYSYWYNKPFILLMILANIDIFISKRGWQYFRSKLTFLPAKN